MELFAEVNLGLAERECLLPNCAHGDSLLGTPGNAKRPRWEVAKRAGLLKRDGSKKGQTLSLTDTTIAAIALEYNLTLITDNLKHYPMPQLKLYPRP